ncbi:uncharacterized protein LOC108719050 isoform X2 [Xenopus laevis]|uniref:Uncharacterized protein n=2 Tax=Xenopus laevis TaxID=8355 RepID=A0A974CPW2_XENLA|nr:uncharacterized protein LOC108719050 isoform X2 [Xenopus laevis]OCT76196.1 hypothetical protein XELAEV_18031391mg [Xenopus laevis]
MRLPTSGFTKELEINCFVGRLSNDQGLRFLLRKSGLSSEKRNCWAQTRNKLEVRMEDEQNNKGEKKNEKKKDDLIAQEFQNNADFLDYLKMFEIHNDEDASFICKIAKNFTTALVSYQEQEKKMKASQPSSDKSNQEHSKKPSDKTVSSPLTSSSSVFRETSSNPQSVPPTNDATEVFFNSIKNMEASEVVGVFQKIAATNPAFKGIDIPSLMKYLQETGKLKNS